MTVSGTLKACALDLSKMCNDLRLLSSGPRTGLGEINLPAKQNGSSIMPGKVNPVIPEVVSQVAFQVVGHDMTISMAADIAKTALKSGKTVREIVLENRLMDEQTLNEVLEPYAMTESGNGEMRKAM